MSSLINRRDFLIQAAAAGGALCCAPKILAAERKMKLCLSPGAIGVKAAPRELVLLARKHGFEAIEPSTEFLARLNDSELAEFQVQRGGLAWGAAGLPVEFRGDNARFEASLAALPGRAAALKRAGVDRVSTWISPGHAELAHADNLKQHAGRLRAAAKILADQGQRLGLEYVGTPTARQRSPHPFIHSMSGMKELITEIGTGNVGFVLDSWHWWTAGESEADLLTLKAADIVSVDLNDAPAGIPVGAQQDGKRELPCATGVIPMRTFLSTLQRLGYDGPMRAEPFNKPLNDMGDEEACAATMVALRKAVALLE